MGLKTVNRRKKLSSKEVSYHCQLTGACLLRRVQSYFPLCQQFYSCCSKCKLYLTNTDCILLCGRPSQASKLTILDEVSLFPKVQIIEIIKIILNFVYLKIFHPAVRIGSQRAGNQLWRKRPWGPSRYPADNVWWFYHARQSVLVEKKAISILGCTDTAQPTGQGRQSLVLPLCLTLVRPHPQCWAGLPSTETRTQWSEFN